MTRDKSFPRYLVFSGWFPQLGPHKHRFSCAELVGTTVLTQCCIVFVHTNKKLIVKGVVRPLDHIIRVSEFMTTEFHPKTWQRQFLPQPIRTTVDWCLEKHKTGSAIHPRHHSGVPHKHSVLQNSDKNSGNSPHGLEKLFWQLYASLWVIFGEFIDNVTDMWSSVHSDLTCSCCQNVMYYKSGNWFCTQATHVCMRVEGRFLRSFTVSFGTVRFIVLRIVGPIRRHFPLRVHRFVMVQFRFIRSLSPVQKITFVETT